MEQNVRFCDDGQVEIPMLWKAVPHRLPDSEFQASQRLKGLHQKLALNPRLSQQYHEGIIQDLNKGYIRRLPTEEASALHQRTHWMLPHFAVFHPDKPDKCQRVLDAAAKNAGVSLNSLLNPGPNNLTALHGCLLRFRCGQFAVNGDITEFFSQIAVTKSDQDMLTFLWNEHPQAQPNVYVSKRHIFGATCSPSIANFALRHVVKQAQNPSLDKIAHRHVYVDDLYWSANSAETVIDTARAFAGQLSKHRISIAKWISNDPQIIRSFGEAERHPTIRQLNDSTALPRAKALSVAWDCKHDTLTFSSRHLDNPGSTPAEVLSCLASVYDPLGLLGPVLLTGKLQMQLIWQTTKDWKMAAPERLVTTWRQWVGSLADLTHVAFPRWLSITATDPCQLYVFTDASKLGYGAVAYIGVEGREPTLLFSKNRVVNPLKPSTIPRLELNGALVGARITKTLLEELTCTVPIVKVHFFVDSVVVLHWIWNERTKYGEYVHNRLQEIQGLQDDERFARLAVDFRHVPTNINPADLVSRGQTTEEFLAADHFWQHGPSFLTESPDRWPPVFPVTADKIDESLEARPTPAAAYVAQSLPTNSFASLREFLEAQLGCRNIDPDVFDAELLNQIKQAQEDTFPRYVTHLRQHHRQRPDGLSWIPRDGPLQRHHLFLDASGLLRIVTRLDYADFLSVDFLNVDQSSSRPSTH